jgi:hypothetical protein
MDEPSGRCERPDGFDKTKVLTPIFRSQKTSGYRFRRRNNMIGIRKIAMFTGTSTA